MRAAMCPASSCVCDWKGTWPDDDAKGFANWDLSSLGIDESKDARDTMPEIARLGVGFGSGSGSG